MRVNSKEVRSPLEEEKISPEAFVESFQTKKNEVFQRKSERIIDEISGFFDNS